MARILLGVTGGIAAYKALELVREAGRAGHAVRVLMTRRRQALRRTRLVRGDHRRAGAHLEFERDPIRGAFPGDPAARPRPDRPPRGGRQRRRLPGRSGLGQHRRQARRRDGRLDGHHLLPRLRGAAARRPGDERPHVPRRGDPGQPRDAARAGRQRDRARRGLARLARGARRRAPARSGAGCSTRSRPSARRRAGPGTGSGSWSPPAAPASRSTRCASSATAPAAAWAWRSPRRPRAAGPR